LGILDFHNLILASRIPGFNAAKEKLEIVSGAAPPPFRIFAGGLFRKNAFGLIQEYCTSNLLSF